MKDSKKVAWVFETDSLARMVNSISKDLNNGYNQIGSFGNNLLISNKKSQKNDDWEYYIKKQELELEKEKFELEKAKIGFEQANYEKKLKLSQARENSQIEFYLAQAEMHNNNKAKRINQNMMLNNISQAQHQQANTNNNQAINNKDDMIILAEKVNYYDEGTKPPSLSPRRKKRTKKNKSNFKNNFR